VRERTQDCLEPNIAATPKRGYLSQCKSSVFSKLLLPQLKQCRLVGNEILLFAYLNEDIYDGIIAKLLGAVGLYIKGMVQKPSG